MSRAIVPINQLDRRLVEHGRIRIGEKTAKKAPTKIDTFRFTSSDKEAIAEIAGHFGGTVKPWAEKAGQWEVKTTSKEIPVILPPRALGDTPVYELWSGGGAQRRCDGEVCLVPTMTNQGAEMIESPCICVQNNALACKPKTRLTVILPDIRFGGGWRLESGGWNVAQEMPGMVDMIERLQQRGMQRALLALEPRTSKFAGQTRHFMVPVLRPSATVNEMLEGGGSVLGLAPAPVPENFPELETPEAPAVEVPVDVDDQIVDAEIVEEVGVAAGSEAEPPAPSASSTSAGEGSGSSPAPIDEVVSEEIQRKRKKMFASLKDIGLDNTARHALVMRITNGRSDSSNDLDEGGLDMLLAAIDAIRKGDAFYDGVDDRGFAIVTRR